MKIATIILLSGFCFLFFVNPSALPQCVEKVDLYGIVLESGTGQPIPEVLVCVDEYCILPCTSGPIICGLCTKTNSAGSFQIIRDCDFIESAPLATWFFLHLSKDGYEPKSIDDGKSYQRQCYSGLLFEISVDFQTIYLSREPSGIIEMPGGGIPDRFELHQNYPNPFNLGTTIKFTLAEPATIELAIFNILGRVIKTTDLGFHQPGTHTVYFDGMDNGGKPWPSGVYFYRMTAGAFARSKRMVLLK